MSYLLKNVRAAALALATAVAGLTPAHAIIVTGNWDPAYGTPFPDLGWTGTVKFDVPAGWLTDNTSTNIVHNGVYPPPPECPIATIGSNANCSRVTELSVTLYQLSNPSNTEVLSWDVSDDNVWGKWVEAVTTNNNLVVDLKSDIASAKASTKSWAGNGQYSFVPVFTGNPATTGSAAQDGVGLVLVWVENGGSETSALAQDQFSQNPPNELCFTVTGGTRNCVIQTAALPEPGSLLLAALALLGAGVAARRRSA